MKAFCYKPLTQGIIGTKRSGGALMYFNQQMFNPNTVNPQYYQSIRNQIQAYHANQDLEVAKAVKAVHDLCEAVKKMDEPHQKEAFFLCLGQMAADMNWQ